MSTESVRLPEEEREEWARRLIAYKAKYPNTDIWQFVSEQQEKGLLIVDCDLWDDDKGELVERRAVVLFGDRFSSKRKVWLLLADGSRKLDVNVYRLRFLIGSRRKVHWPLGVTVGGRTKAMYRALDRRWRGGR